MKAINYARFKLEEKATRSVIKKKKKFINVIGDKFAMNIRWVKLIISFSKKLFSCINYLQLSSVAFYGTALFQCPLKTSKGGGSMVQGQVFLKGGWHFSYLIFSRFIIFTFRYYFTLCKIVLYIWRKIIFFCHHNFMKKGHSKLSKNEPENIP